MTFITTVEKAGELIKKRILPDNQRINYMKPIAIDIYNHHMGGVDIMDQYMDSADATRRSHVWFKKLGIHLLQRLLMNAFIRFRCEQQPGVKNKNEQQKRRRSDQQPAQPVQHCLEKITNG